MSKAKMGSPKLPAEGRCRCGMVRFLITQKPILTMACHCKGCQRMTASAFSLSVAVPTKGFEITHGNTVIGGLHGAAHHHFCPWCMSWLYTKQDGLDQFVNVRVTMLDETEWFTPFIETMVSEKLGWVSVGAIHSFDKFPAFEDFDGLIKEYASAAG